MKNLKKEKLFDVIITARNEKNKTFHKLIESIVKNINYINFVIIVIEEKMINKIKSEIENSNLDKNKFVIISEKNETSKIQKLKLASNYISEGNYIITLDEDDLLNSFSDVLNVDEDVDLFFTPLNWKINNNESIWKFNSEIDHWYEIGNFPYFNNHNSIPRSDLFKKVIESFVDTSFQKHEDVMRTLMYISYSKKIFQFLDDNSPLIKYFIDTKNQHESSENVLSKEAESMNSLLTNFEKMEIIFSSDIEYRISQINALKRIYRTALPLNELKIIDNNLFNNFEKILKENGIDIDKNKIFHNRYLKEFYIQMINGKKLKWFKT